MVPTTRRRLKCGVIVNETDDRFYIAESTVPGAGRGLFARVPLSTGDRLAVIGVLVAPDSLSDQLTAYTDEYKLRLGSLLLIPLGYGGMVNHSADPNLEKQVEGDSLYLRVTRPVQAGEELFFSYSDYARQRYGIDT